MKYFDNVQIKIFSFIINYLQKADNNDKHFLCPEFFFVSHKMPVFKTPQL